MSEMAWAMLTAKTADLEPIPATFGSLKPSDIAAMLAGLKHRKFLAGMLVLAGDRSVWHELENHVYVRAMLLAAEHDWGMPKGPRLLRALAKLAILDVTTAGRPCPPCEASGVIVSPEGYKSQCEHCHGTGKRAFAEYELSQLAEIPERTWRHTWGERYQAIYRDFCGDVEDARRYLSRQMKAA